MASSPNAPKVVSAGDSLPPVEPPSTSFILQLFVVPAIIVVIIVLVWFLFNWIALGGADPKVYLQAIEQDNANSWSSAHRLAMELQTNDALKQDSELAQRLAQMLDGQMTAAKMDEDKIRLRIFLCKSLGEFRVPEGLPILLKAATTQRQQEEIEVRRSAIESIALLLSNLKKSPGHDKHQAEALPTLIAASKDDAWQVREPSAFALGTLGGDSAIARLKEMLGDTHANTRYNAATGLARQGSAAGSEVLIEMLDLAELELDARESEGLDLNKRRVARDFKRALISINALRAVTELAQAGQEVPLPLQAAVQQVLDTRLESLFADAQYAAGVRVHADDAKQKMAGSK